VLDRIPPQSLLTNVVNLTDVPPFPHLSYRLQLNDGSLKYELVPVGSQWNQLTLYILLGILPILTAASAAIIFVQSFYQIKFNEFGTSQGRSSIQLLLQFNHKSKPQQDVSFFTKASAYIRHSSPKASLLKPSPRLSPSLTPQSGRFEESPLVVDAGAPSRRVVLIATMEYDIEDWGIKIKIGGLGVMAQLMGKNLGHQDLIWVVPCVGGIEYPEDPNEVAEPMEITVFEQIYQIQVRTHRLRNITYVLLDAPVFRQQSKSEPYPPRMDDLDSAIYYSAWNSCIAETIRRFKPDLYHINDYHGAVAPLHLLPDTIPCALSLHNAEFQGLWPMRSKQEREEVCKVYNLDLEIVEEYIQFGEVFNLLHAGASYLRIHQKGFGAVGVSKKYGKRSYARYPIFWGLKEIKALPNPDPSDTGEWHRDEVGQKSADIQIDPQFEAERGALRVEAQKWAGLTVNPTADLFVFVGRWSMQKGVDLIADIFPSILEKYQNTQLICIGPVIDLYGRFAAIKLEKMMSVYPGRVFSKPEFTALPPYIFSGAEFALIPSRDEPFGLVAVEFGRKGALGVGARVGGLGQMPGWWYTVESTSTKHLLHQFKGAIEGALDSDNETRALLRARSARQRFPVAQWVEDLESLQTTAIRRHEKYSKDHKRRSLLGELGGWASPANRSRATSRAASEAPSEARGGRKRRSLLGELSGWASPANRSRATSRAPSELPSEAPSPKRNSSPVPAHPDSTSETLQRMGSRRRPGHVPKPRRDRTSDGTLLEEEEEDILDHYLSSSDDDDDDQPRGRSLQVQRSGNRLGPLDGSLEEPAGLGLRSGSATGNGSSAQLLGHHATSPLPSTSHHDRQTDTNLLSAPEQNHAVRIRAMNESSLSLASVVGEKKDFELQKVNHFFTDPKQDYSKAFEKKLADLSAKNSYNTCIEEFIEKSEKDWFNRLRDKQMGKPATPASSIFRSRRNDFPTSSIYSKSVDGWEGGDQDDADDQFLLKPDYKPPTGVKKFMLHRLGEWPVYSLLLALVSCSPGIRSRLPLIHRIRVKSLPPTRIKSHCSRVK
jgi:alpha-1,3-glucan synthase